MPMYEYQCRPCSKDFEKFLPLAQYNNPQTCPDCGGLAIKILSPTPISMDYSGYSCPISGKWIEGRRAHRENLAKHGCRVYEPGEKKDAERFRKEQDQKLDQQIEETATRLISSLPPRKMKALKDEINSGADINIIRK